MHIVLGMDWHVVIEDVADFGDVEAARRYVACRKEGDGAGPEGIERRRALMLVHVAMQGSDIEAMALQRAIEDADVLLAVAEDDGVLDVDLPHQAPQRLPLAGRIVRGLLEPLHDGRRGGPWRGAGSLEAWSPRRTASDE